MAQDHGIIMAWPSHGQGDWSRVPSFLGPWVPRTLGFPVPPWARSWSLAVGHVTLTMNNTLLNELIFAKSNKISSY